MVMNQKIIKRKSINGVLMQANDLLNYRDKIINAFKNGTFCLNIKKKNKKKTDDAANNYLLEVLNKYIEEIKSMEEKFYLSLFKEFFELSSSANYAKMLINTKNRNENKK